MNKNKIIYVSAAAIILIAILIFFITNNSIDKVTSKKNTTDKNLLIGNWGRTDAIYLIKIIKINDDCTLDAEYYNPNPINVGKATWDESYGNLKIVVELRDVNYPGSTYTLNYLPDRDMLAGEYYQAVEGVTFYVEFVRNK